MDGETGNDTVAKERPRDLQFIMGYLVGGTVSRAVLALIAERERLGLSHEDIAAKLWPRSFKKHGSKQQKAGRRNGAIRRIKRIEEGGTAPTFYVILQYALALGDDGFKILIGVLSRADELRSEL